MSNNETRICKWVVGAFIKEPSCFVNFDVIEPCEVVIHYKTMKFNIVRAPRFVDLSSRQWALCFLPCSGFNLMSRRQRASYIPRNINFYLTRLGPGLFITRTFYTVSTFTISIIICLVSQGEKKIKEFHIQTRSNLNYNSQELGCTGGRDVYIVQIVTRIKRLVHVYRKK